MHHEHAQAKRMGVEAACRQMSAALGEAPPEIEPIKERLKDDQAAEGSHLRVRLEFDAWNTANTTVNRACWNFHFWWPFV